jgi:hypothetical protein
MECDFLVDKRYRPLDYEKYYENIRYGAWSKQTRNVCGGNAMLYHWSGGYGFITTEHKMVFAKEYWVIYYWNNIREDGDIYLDKNRALNLWNSMF